MGLSGYLLTEADWEAKWAPYDEGTYQQVLDHIFPEDIVLDIGAGDLRLARRMVDICRRVYAIENQAHLLSALNKPSPMRAMSNLIVQPGDARYLPFPQDVTVGVLLMRHCTHFPLYAKKLKKVGASRLITNARWKMGVEVISLHSERISYRDVEIGWYACWCGGTGFKPGPAENVAPELDLIIHEVIDCPSCKTVMR